MIIKFLRKKVYGYEVFKNFLDDHKQYSFLDIGCGKIPFFLEFHNTLKNYHGVDVKVKNNIFKNIKLENRSVENLSIEELNKYDVILIIDVLHHLKIEVINNLFNKLLKLNRGKLIIIKDPIDENLLNKFIHLAHDFFINKEIIHFNGHQIVSEQFKDKIDIKIIKNNFWYKNVFFKILT